MSKHNPPCIRGLKKFEKTGCPQRCWDGEEGCPAWVEQPVGTEDDPLKVETRKKCVDLWNFDLLWSILKRTEGNQQAIESFRNGMVQMDSSGTVHPKPDPAMLTLVKTVQDQIKKNEIIHEHETKKLIEDKDKL